MAVRSIKSIRNVRGKRVLVRVDYNVPIKNGRVADDTRLVASLPTIHYLVKKGARVILLSHVGRPEGKRVKKLSLAPVAKRLGTLLGKRVAFVPEYAGVPVKRRVMQMNNGEVLLLENMRFSPEESRNTGTLAKQLANYGECFVLDGFAVAHRGDASVAGVAKYLPSAAGVLLEKEIAGLTKVMRTPKHPFVLVIGGAKMETKVPVIKKLLSKTDAIVTGGGIVNTYLKAKGYGVGASLVDAAYRAQALAFGKNKKIFFPLDVIVGTRFGHGGRRVMIGPIPHRICKANEAILDIGPATIRFYASIIKQAKTIVWNGAMGLFEQKPFDVGTKSIARLVAAQSKGKAFGVIGGGETVQSMALVGMTEDVDLVSTGGGAMLEFLAGKTLPGIEALKAKRSRRENKT